MPDLIAIKYAEEITAGQAAEELERRAEDLLIDPDAIGVIVCARDGNCQLMTSRHPGAKTGWSKFWGAVLGAVMGDVRVTGIDPACRDRIHDMLTPGSSILLIAIANPPLERAIEAVSQYGGNWLKCSLAVDRFDVLREVLDGVTEMNEGGPR